MLLAVVIRRVVWALALAVLTSPSAVSAATWDPPSTSHSLTSTNLSFTAATLGLGSICSSSSFATSVSATGAATITGATFIGCSGTDSVGACTDVTTTSTHFPWAVTALSTTDVLIQGIDIDLTFGGPCAGTVVTLAGSLTAAWSNTTRNATFTNANGLTVTASGTTAATVLNGTAHDAQNTLTIT